MDLRHGIEKAALTIRSLAIDAIERADSGHPGLPLGMAEAGALLFSEILKHNPDRPDWINRDRFVLSAGHGSMLLYSLLYLSGYDVTLEDIKQFRQLNSRTPGHPEVGFTSGVETTTGPLGQGVANAVGMAIAEQMLAARFNTKTHPVIDHHTYVLAGDGCMMEGVTAEACSLAGHLKLGKLIVFYDRNKITIDGSTDLTFSEDVAARFRSYGWMTHTLDAYDIEAMLTTIKAARADTIHPTLIVLNSIIGKGSPHKAGTEKCHGAPLGPDEVLATKKALGLPETKLFYVDPDAKTFFDSKRSSWGEAYAAWERLFNDWKKQNPDLAKLMAVYFGSDGEIETTLSLPAYQAGDKVATRDSNGVVLNAFAGVYPQIVGGSADLASSNKSVIKGADNFQSRNRTGRNINFGVREHAMGAITNGIALHGGLRPYCSTFFVFSDYMRPPIRLAALMKLPVLYFFTHDSIYVGEDGPTHQPVEHFAAMRVIPNLEVWRPGDAQENIEIFKLAFSRREGPSLLGLSRQGIVVYEKEDPDWRVHIDHGAYIVREAASKPKLIIIATGSEVQTALATEQVLGRKDVRVISMPCRERFLRCAKTERDRLLLHGVPRIVIEAGVIQGWEGILGDDGLFVGMNDFGVSAKAQIAAAHFGFDPEKIAARILELL